MEKYSAVKSGKEPDLSDYKEYKLKEDNIGMYTLLYIYYISYSIYVHWILSTILRSQLCKLRLSDLL